MERRIRWGLLLALCASLVGLVAWATPSIPKTQQVIVHAYGQVVPVATQAKTAEDAIYEAGFVVGPGDVVLPSATAALYSGAVVTLVPARGLNLTIDGQTHQIQTARKTVDEVLQDNGVALGNLDQAVPSLTASVHPGMDIVVHRVEERVETSKIDVPFDTERRADPSLGGSVVKAIQDGKAGLDEVTEKVIYKDGQPVARERLTVKRLLEPVTALLAYGTMNTVSRGGADYHYTRAITLTATGYTAGKESNPNGNGITYTGLPAKRGVVAVDPRVIPLYSRLYIEGYGPAVAADIGGAIKGDRIDLCFDSLGEALDWGVRDATVYVLGN